MNLFVYSDESGVFDSAHHDYFVFGGVLFLDKNNRDIATRRYHAAERSIRNAGGYSKQTELKASVMNNKEKGKIMRSLNQELKFAVVIDQKALNANIFSHKTHRQRYLDYAFKIALKRFLISLAKRGTLSLDSIKNMYVFCDDHTTATSGRYELEEALLKEFKYGTFNEAYQTFFPPCTLNLNDLMVDFCDSSRKTLVRAADVIANHVYSCVVRKVPISKPNLFVTRLP